MISLYASIRAPAEKWGPLFYRILKNRIRDWQRHGVVKGRVPSFFGGQEGGPFRPCCPSAGPSTSNPDEAVAVVGDGRLGKGACEGFPRRQREAFMLRNFEGLSVSETRLP
ncbi:MAG: hypothetical protein CM1200mP36_09870 [Gammaproteobacteria bacterium]|nr:MAG: hypothetical protein CM1200mP36_09870 [Gammaproteobacteria bacterium]